jgi:hypothetical protein
MHASDTKSATACEARIVAQPPFDPKEPLPVSRTRVCIGLLLFISGFALSSSSTFFPSARAWIASIGILLIICSFFILGLHRLRGRGRDPRKLYGHERI